MYVVCHYKDIVDSPSWISRHGKKDKRVAERGRCEICKCYVLEAVTLLEVELLLLRKMANKPVKVGNEVLVLQQCLRLMLVNVKIRMR